MRRLQPEPSSEKPPGHLLELDPERYRQVAKLSLREHPGDGWCAAFMVWRCWQQEAQAWQAERGVVWGVKGWRTQLGPGRPPLGWVREEFGLPLESRDTPCGPNCRIHRAWNAHTLHQLMH